MSGRIRPPHTVDGATARPRRFCFRATPTDVARHVHVAPEWIEYQRRRFTRHDAHRFIRPDADRFIRPGADPPRAPEQAGAAIDEMSEAELLEYRHELAKLRLDWELFKLSLKASKAGFNPAQPRDDRGRWTDTGTGGAALEQRLKTALDQPFRDDLRDLQNIADDPSIRLRIDESWTASSPYGATPREHGFWISRNEITGELFTRPFAGVGSAASIMPGPVPSDAIAFFHTHPNQGGYLPGPSAADNNFAMRSGIPGLIQSHSGMYYFGPDLRPRRPR